MALLCSDAPEAERPAASALQHAAVSTLVPPLPPAAMRAATRGQRIGVSVERTLCDL